MKTLLTLSLAILASISIGKAQCYNPYNSREQYKFGLTVTGSLAYQNKSGFIGINASAGFSAGPITVEVGRTEYKIYGKSANYSTTVLIMHDINIDKYMISPYLKHGTKEYNEWGIMFKEQDKKKPAFVRINTRLDVEVGMHVRF